MITGLSIHLLVYIVYNYNTLLLYLIIFSITTYTLNIICILDLQYISKCIIRSRLILSLVLYFRNRSGDNWSGIMKDTLNAECGNSSTTGDASGSDALCLGALLAPIYFVVFVLVRH